MFFLFTCLFVCQYVPKSFVALHSVIHPRAVTEFIYRYNVSGDRAHVLLSFKLQSDLRETEVRQVLAELANKDMQGIDISDDEMAKSHVRYMIGGCQRVDDERVFRFGIDDILRLRYLLSDHLSQLFQKGRAPCASFFLVYTKAGISLCFIIGITGEVSPFTRFYIYSYAQKNL